MTPKIFREVLLANLDDIWRAELQFRLLYQKIILDILKRNPDTWTTQGAIYVEIALGLDGEENADYRNALSSRMTGVLQALNQEGLIVWSGSRVRLRTNKVLAVPGEPLPI